MPLDFGAAAPSSSAALVRGRLGADADAEAVARLPDGMLHTRLGKYLEVDGVATTDFS